MKNLKIMAALKSKNGLIIGYTLVVTSFALLIDNYIETKIERVKYVNISDKEYLTNEGCICDYLLVNPKANDIDAYNYYKVGRCEYYIESEGNVIKDPKLKGSTSPLQNIDYIYKLSRPSKLEEAKQILKEYNKK